MSLNSIVVKGSICCSDSKELKYFPLEVTPKLLASLYAKKKNNWLVLAWSKSYFLRIVNAAKTFFPFVVIRFVITAHGNTFRRLTESSEIQKCIISFK